MEEIEPEPGAELSIDVARGQDESLIVTVGGELDMSAIAKVQAEVDPLLEQNPPRLIVDVAALRFADSSAIALLVRWAGTAQQFELRNPSPLLRRIISAMGLSEKLGVEA